MSPPPEKKEVAIGYLLWSLSFVGVCGVQRMYLGQVGYGIALLFTLGFCGIGQLLDLLLLPEAVNHANRSSGVSIGGSIPAASVSAVSAATSRPSASEVSPVVSAADDDELGDLLKAAEASVDRARQAREE